MNHSKLSTLIAFTMLALSSGVLLAAEAVNITYGYNPYWTGGWGGVIIKHRELHRKYLPKGITVKFEAHPTGLSMVNALLGNKIQISTMGDMPALVATTKRNIADIRLVSTPMFSNGQNCNKIVVPADTPDFKSIEEAARWLTGKPFTVHPGTCANRFIDSIIRKGAFVPSDRLSMTIEGITSSLEAGKLEGGVAMWEPHARRVVESGYARYVATGTPWGETDAGFTLMRQDFIEQHPRAAIGWMRAEIDAMLFIIKNPKATVEILFEELTGYSKANIWSAIYEENPEAIGGDPVNYEAKMVFDEDVIELINNGYVLLNDLAKLEQTDVPTNVYNDMPIKRALAKMGLSAPIGKIKGKPRSMQPYQD